MLCGDACDATSHTQCSLQFGVTAALSLPTKKFWPQHWGICCKCEQIQATAAPCVTCSASNVCTATANTQYHLYSKSQPCLLSWLQGSFQVCLNAGQASEQGALFLADGCRPLKAAFANDNLMLRPAAAGVPPGGQTILWYAAFCFCCQILVKQTQLPAVRRLANMRHLQKIDLHPCKRTTASEHLLHQAYSALFLASNKPPATGMIQKQQS